MIGVFDFNGPVMYWFCKWSNRSFEKLEYFNSSEIFGTVLELIIGGSWSKLCPKCGERLVSTGVRSNSNRESYSGRVRLNWSISNWVIELTVTKV